MEREGYIKFNCRWEKAGPPRFAGLDELIEVRNRLFKRGRIGSGPDGIGYGNISGREEKERRFVISGTQTGSLETLDAGDFTEVTGWDIPANSLTCRGPRRASSESLTHAAIYDAQARIQAVIHVHSRPLWKALLGSVPSTSADAAYGTPEMAMEILRLLQDEKIYRGKVLVMAGHEDGLLFFGEKLKETEGFMEELFLNHEKQT